MSTNASKNISIVTLDKEGVVTKIKNTAYQTEVNTRMAAFTKEHAEVLRKYYPSQSEFIDDMFNAWTYNLNPAITIPATLVVMKEYLEKQKFGMFGYADTVRVPLSYVGYDMVRYKLPVTVEQHMAFLTGNMGQKNVELFNEVAKKHNICYVRGCCCGLYLTKAENKDKLIKSRQFEDMDMIRSACDRLAYPVVIVEKFEDLPENNYDLTSSEIEMITEIDSLIEKLSKEVSYSNEFVLERVKEAQTRMQKFVESNKF